AGRTVKLAIDGHRAPHRTLTRGRLRVLLCQYAVDPKASGTRILTLNVQDLLEQRERELVVRMLWRPRPLVLQARAAIAFKGLQDGIDMGARQLQAVGDTLFVPAFIRHLDYHPARLVRIGKRGKRRETELELDWRVVGF